MFSFFDIAEEAAKDTARGVAEDAVKAEEAAKDAAEDAAEEDRFNLASFRGAWGGRYDRLDLTCAGQKARPVRRAGRRARPA